MFLAETARCPHAVASGPLTRVDDFVCPNRDGRPPVELMNSFGHTLGGPARLKMFYKFEGFMAPENTYPESSKPGHHDEARNAQPAAAFSGASTLFEKVDKGFLVDSDLRSWHLLMIGLTAVKRGKCA